MFAARIFSKEASREMPARWMIASTPRTASRSAVLSARSAVTASGSPSIGAQVEEPQLVAVGREQVPHQGAEAAGGAGEQNGAGSGHPRVSFGLSGRVMRARYSHPWTR